MKGVILSTSFFILIISTFLSLGWYTNFEHNRSIINNTFKKALFQSAYLMKDKEEINESIVVDTLVKEIEDSLPANFDYQIKLVGFNADPILMRVKIDCSSKNNLYNFTLEETLIEKELEDEEE